MPITKKDMFEAGTQAGQSFSNAFMGMLSLRAEEKMQDDERRREAREATNQLGTALDTYRQMYPDLNIPDEPLGDMSPDMAGQLFRLIGAGAAQANAAAIAKNVAGSAEERARRTEERENRQQFIENERAFDRRLSLRAVEAGLKSAGAGEGEGAGEGNIIAHARNANLLRGYGKGASAPLVRLVLGGETGYATYPKDGEFTGSTARSTYTSGLPAEMYSAVRYEYNQGKNPSQIANILFPGIQEATQLQIVTQAIEGITAISSQQDQESTAFTNSVFRSSESDKDLAAIVGDPNLSPKVEQIVGDYDEAMAGTIDNPSTDAEEQATEEPSPGRPHDPRTPPWEWQLEPSPGGDTREAATAAVADTVRTKAVEKAAASAAMATVGSDTGAGGPVEEGERGRAHRAGRRQPLVLARGLPPNRARTNSVLSEIVSSSGLTMSSLTRSSDTIDNDIAKIMNKYEEMAAGDLPGLLDRIFGPDRHPSLSYIDGYHELHGAINDAISEGN